MAFQNQLKTVILLGALTGLLLWIGSFWGSNGLIIALVFSIVINFFSYWFSDKLVLKMYKAKEVTEKEAPKLYKAVSQVAHLANIPMPKVYITPQQTSNAFATGRNVKHSAVAATQGLLDLLNEEELKGVFAHEISHIKNRDTLISVIAATIAGVISYIAFMARFAAIFGGGSRDRNGGGLELLVLAILTPILAALIRMAISRSREYLADESGAKLLHSGFGLASALEKLHNDVTKKPLKPTSTAETTAHMMIINPFKAGGLVNLFMTHPPAQERIKRLRAMNF
jgi:heat shock protein HtpX